MMAEPVMVQRGSRIAVIGSGISGMAAAYFLSRRYEVHLFEKEERIGGHTHTHLIEEPESDFRTAVDTGFIVHNDHTYPNLVRLFAELGVKRQASDMSFGVSCKDTGFEYSSRGLKGFFAQRTNLLRLRHYCFFRELLRFNREAPKLLKEPDVALTLGEYLEQRRFSKDFTDLYLFPMASAVWSTSLEKVRDFPALTLVKFFMNHGFLGIDTQFEWKTLKGGSSMYIAPLTAPYRDRIHTSANIARVVRSARGVQLEFEHQPPRQFDHVVLATHAPQALALLGDPTADEKRILTQFQTSRSRVWLHTDASIMPKRKDAWASWNYHLSRRSGCTGSPAATVTYHMNRLQGLNTARQYFVTLNASAGINERTILRELEYSHPLYTVNAVRAQKDWDTISGRNRTHFCGAYWFYGFHEDGLNSALRVARALGVKWDEKPAAESERVMAAR
ncbi:MAG TPA: FAD-dependent oxidoreductase [Terriglobales bacterium]